MKKTSKISTIAVIAALTGSAAVADTRVTIGELSWQGSRALEQILAQVMTEYLDAEISTLSATQNALYEGMDRGDGSVDVVADMWTSSLPVQMQNYVEEGSRESIILNDTPYIGYEGIYVPAYVAEDLGVTRLEQLADPEIAKLFDNNGDGLGEMWGGAPGWESTNQTLVRAKSYGFDDTMSLSQVDQAVAMAILDDAYTDKRPYAFYFWTPEWIFAKYDLVRLEEPEFNGFATPDYEGTPDYNEDGCYAVYQPSVRNDWLEASELKCHNPPQSVHVAHSSELAERAPEISQFLKQVQFKAEDVSNVLFEMQQNGRSVEAVATEWIEENIDMVENDWLAGLR